ncbi:8-oxo-dGTP pyrophosphatase MutT (NUDIX family) [Silvimonas terrae]|uniref:8-oxo-dGTP pyrophosphatase MutT (NUDIX family) n=1 Tax=Silvimonas terrae TaxID=300266 RepID=A0A840R8A4_9NEIS|nr:DUF4743 domain-containing protein [Silvimonas terrae]MBB5189569.1 8-oxo-dGTP pyrophosphatase MutT (NUDIX family) [Silvimonas terrae]
MPLRREVEQYIATHPRFAPAGLTRLTILGFDLGWLEPATVAFLTAHSPLFVRQGERVVLQAQTGAAAEQALTGAAIAMRAAGLIKGWRNELYTVLTPRSDGTPDFSRPLFQLERGAFRRFGLLSLAVHINGWRDDQQLWIGQRAASKAVDPGRLDNLAAGGMSAGEDARACAIRELWEEAGLPAILAEQAVAAGEIRTTRNEVDGTHDEILYCYDLAVPADFTPRNTDGEVAGFIALGVDELVARLPQLTWDAGLVTGDFLLRKGWV